MVDPYNQGFELNGLLFGDQGNVLVESFEPSGYEIKTQDADPALGNVRLFGRDFKNPSTWSWSLGINRDDELGAYETLAAIQNAWDDEELQATPGAVVPLRYRVGERTRRVYGRPRRCTPVLDARRLAGYIGVEADFVRSDTRHYDDAESVAVLDMQPAHVGGLTSPLVSPLTSLDANTGRSGQILVEGDTPTPIVIEIQGQISRPWIEVVGQWTARLETVIATGDVVTLDPHPWAMSATRSSGGTVAGSLLGVRLSQLMLPPGLHQINFGGTSSTGGAVATVRWRAASKSL